MDGEKRTAAALGMRAWELIEWGWCKGDFARDENGQTVEPTSRDAVAFCPVGAIEAMYRDSPNGSQAIEKLHDVIGRDWPSISVWNDDPARTQEEVLAAMKQADV